MSLASRQRVWNSLCEHPWVYGLSAGVGVIFLLADILLPRGATVAIGYCLVPVVLTGTRKHNALFEGTLLCIVLTWLGYFLEPAGVPAWSSAFDRTMVSAILCLGGLLMWRRLLLVEKFAHLTHELQRSNTELEGYAYVVAHDIRGPLQSISLLIDIISRSQSLRFDESIAAMQSELSRLNSLIDRSLTYGRAECGELIRDDCDCETILADVRRALHCQIEQSRATITSDRLPVINADACLISELFQNLIENSIKYSGDRAPEIHLCAKENADSWIFYVHDNGVGIPQECAATVFEPFHRVERLRAVSKGVGLGLATCKRIVERHGGRIEVQSAPGQGSTFIFFIPRVQQPATATAESTVADAHGKGFWDILDDALVVPQGLLHQ